MKVKRINRYYCDFCKKAGCSGGHMKRHEQGCTLNPNRICGVCKMIDAVQKPMAELLKLLPDVTQYENTDGYYHGTLFPDTVKAMLPDLRKAVDNCPACIMAALRQAKIPIPIATDFNWTKEMEAVWRDINEARYETEHTHY